MRGFGELSKVINIHVQDFISFKNKLLTPWPVWLSGLSAGLRTKGHWFDYQSWHTPGLWAMSPVGGGGGGETQPQVDGSRPLILPNFHSLKRK